MFLASRLPDHCCTVLQYSTEVCIATVHYRTVMYSPFLWAVWRPVVAAEPEWTPSLLAGVPPAAPPHHPQIELVGTRSVTSVVALPLASLEFVASGASGVPVAPVFAQRPTPTYAPPTSDLNFQLPLRLSGPGYVQVGFQKLGRARTPSIAVMSYSGYDIEDAIVMNKAPWTGVRTLYSHEEVRLPHLPARNCLQRQKPRGPKATFFWLGIPGKP